MTTRKDVLLLQIMHAFSQGCGGADLEDAAAEWFHQHYYDWIATPRKDPKAGGQSPMTGWGTAAKDVVAKIQEIGRRAASASGGGPVTRAALQKSAADVEGGSDCPWCPIDE
jgi:hypothetical protein